MLKTIALAVTLAAVSAGSISIAAADPMMHDHMSMHDRMMMKRQKMMMMKKHKMMMMKKHDMMKHDM